MKGTIRVRENRDGSTSYVCQVKLNHQIRLRDQHKIIPKHHNTGPSPTRCDHPEQSEKSNWASSPGPVSIGTLAESARRNLGPRWARTQRATVG